MFFLTLLPLLGLVTAVPALVAEPVNFLYPTHLPSTTRFARRSTSPPQSPFTGPNANRCGDALNGAVCGPANAGPCCSVAGWCGASVDHCSGGCQSDFGVCAGAGLQLQFDAEIGDIIWDPSTGEAWDAGVGDGLIVYGASEYS